MLPILAGIVFPMLIISAIVFALRPKGEVAVEPWKKNYNVAYRPSTYVSTTWNTKPERFKYQTQEDPADLHPIFDEVDTLVKASEERMRAEIDAAVKARKILFEIGQERKRQLQLV